MKFNHNSKEKTIFLDSLLCLTFTFLTTQVLSGEEPLAPLLTDGLDVQLIA